MLVAQITDCHVVSPGRLLHRRHDSAAMLAAAVEHLEAMEPRPDLVLATGDLVNNGRPTEYANLVDVLGRLTIPLVAIPGNHDDRTEFRRAFRLAEADPETPINVVHDDLAVRLVGLDTTIPGEHGGLIDDERAAWLDAQLAAAPERPTVVFQHHPPFLTGIDWMDRSTAVGAELEADVVSRHPQVLAILCGHVHRVVHARVGGVPASTWPSTGPQVALALDGTPHGYIDEPPAVALHRYTPEDGLVSHVSLVGGPEPWIPPWAQQTPQDL